MLVETITRHVEKPSVATQPTPLRQCVKAAVEKYFSTLDGQVASELYNMVMSEVEEPLLQSVMRFVEGNQSRAAEILGLNRGTLRKKLDCYGLLK